MLNKVILIGNVGKDPETKTLQGGTQVTKFSLATSESYKNKQGEKITNTEWHNIVMWNKLAEIAEKYVKKGSKLYIEGSIKSDSYENKEGVKVYTTFIQANNMVMLDSKAESKEKDTDQYKPKSADELAEAPEASDEDFEEMPF